MSDSPPDSPIDPWPRPGKRRSRYLWLIGISLYIVALWYFGWRAVGETLLHLQLEWLLLLVFVDLIALWMRAAKWRIALGPDQSATGLFFISKAGGAFSPGRVGELAPLLLPQHRTPKVGAWIVVDRLLEMAGTLGLGLVGFLAIRYSERNVLIAWAATALILIVVPFFVLTRRSLFIKLSEHTSESTLLHRIAMMLAAMSEEIKKLRPKVPLLSAMTVAVTALDIVIGVLILKCFSYDVSFAVLAAAQCVHAVVSVIPISPNATGLPYAAAAVLISEVADLPYEVLVASIPLRFAIINVTFWTFFGIVVPRLKKTAQ